MKNNWTTLLLLLTPAACNPDPSPEPDGKGEDPVPPTVVSENSQIADGTKICVFGDSGTAGDEQMLVASYLKEEGCDQVRVVGDIIYEDGLEGPDDQQFMDKFYDPYKEMLEGDVPFYIALGNHDYNGDTKAWLELANRHTSIIFPAFYYAEVWDDICFVTFDTNTWWGFFPQKDWIEESWPEISEGCSLSLAFGHHPYLSVGDHGDADSDDKDFLKEHVIGRFDAYFSGHDHDLSDEGEVDGTRLIVSGAAGKLRPLAAKPRDFAISALGYVTLTVKREGGAPSIDYEFIVIDSENGRQVVHQGQIK